MRKLLTLLSLSFLFFSCDPDRVYEDNVNLPSAYWQADSIKTFTFEVPDANQDYNIFFNVRNGINFPHTNLYITYTLNDSLGIVLEKSLKNFYLFYPKSGYPYGAGIGDLFEHQFHLLSKYRFPSTGKYILHLQQFMRYDSLPDIYSVGMRIEYSK